jgi:hypothetical protein
LRVVCAASRAFDCQNAGELIGQCAVKARNAQHAFSAFLPRVEPASSMPAPAIAGRHGIRDREQQFGMASAVVD